ncbi:hypothetical protein [uncultured Shewanella sp.]|uniref:hypothetical protein n=1 Tax=uncultured Shewanella sp. TaxID=173975 RepID=UPI0026214677|nr:hypothetical protein [uncultured Shewanella sp.]
MCNRKNMLFSIFIITSLFNLPVNAANVCTDMKKAEILERVSEIRPSVTIDCDVSLKSTDVITKKVYFEGESASNTTLNCNSAKIDFNVGIRAGIFSMTDEDTIIIQSFKDKDTWSVPENIAIHGCQIMGSIRITGMDDNAFADDLTTSSLTAGHTQRSNASAPSNILLKNLEIEALYRPALYLSPGVNRVTLQQSYLHGTSNTVALYLDAESNYHKILENTIAVNTSEYMVALDGSAYNTIEYNYLFANNTGGIYLFRNCGENGMVRHQTASFNSIKNNYFLYNNYLNDKSAVNIGANNGEQSYCIDDDNVKLKHTSSTDNLDNTEGNTVMYNQFLNAEPHELIRFGSDNDEALNEASVYANFRVSSFKQNIEPEIVEFECQIETDSYGCYEYATCPDNKISAAVRAACNLEWGSVSLSDLPLWGHMDIIRESDTLPDSECLVHETSNYLENSHNHAYPSYNNQTFIGCKEHDQNGGDCHILGQQICL